MKVTRKEPPKRKEKSKIPLIIGAVALIMVMAITSYFFFENRLDDTPMWSEEEIISDDPNNYLSKRINLKDGTTHYFYEKTENVGTITPNG